MTKARQNIAKPKGSAGESVGSPSSVVDADELRYRIAEAAYYRAEKRGFEPGYEVADWIEAEFEVGNAAIGVATES